MILRSTVGLALCGAVTAFGQVPSGAEFQANTYTTSRQDTPVVASAGSGNFVVVWASLVQDGYGYGVFARRFGAAGVPQGGEFQVNTYTTYGQYFPAVASDVGGNFVVVWDSYQQDGSDLGIFGQRFNSVGIPQGEEFQVNTYTTQSQAFSAVASDGNENFIVVWHSYEQDGSEFGIFGQRFDTSGVPQGVEFQVNTYFTGSQSLPAVAFDESGNFVVVWHSYEQDGSDDGVFGQRFNSAGIAQGSEFQVNTYTTSRQRRPAVAFDGTGNFVVVWESVTQDGSDDGVFGQRFNAEGLTWGAEFRVNSYTTGPQRRPAVASDLSGGFVVVWQSDQQDGSSWGIFGRRFNAAGLAQGAEFQINTYTTSHQDFAAVASIPNGNFTVVWTSHLQDGNTYGVFGQRFVDDLIFTDDFE